MLSLKELYVINAFFGLIISKLLKNSMLLTYLYSSLFMLALKKVYVIKELTINNNNNQKSDE